MKNVRTTRDSEARQYDTIHAYNMEYVSPLSLPPGIKKEGHSYYWASKSEYSNYEVEALMAARWILVPIDRAPNYCSDPLKRNPLAEKYVCYRDLILMERPEIYCQQETAMRNAFNANRIRSLRGVKDDIGSFGGSAHSINSFY